VNTVLPNASDEAAVRRAVDGFANAWNPHDMESFALLFAPDEEFINVTGQWWQGREFARRKPAN